MNMRRKYKKLGQREFLKWVINQIEFEGQRKAKWVQDARDLIGLKAGEDGQHQIPKWKLVRFAEGHDVEI